MILGLVLLFLGVIMPAAITNLYSLILWRILQGIGFALFVTAAGAAVADILPKDRLGEGIGYYALGQSLGTAVGPMIGIYLIGVYSARETFVVLAAMVALGIILSFTFKDSRIKKGTNKEMLEEGLCEIEGNLCAAILESPETHGHSTVKEKGVKAFFWQIATWH